MTSDRGAAEPCIVHESDCRPEGWRDPERGTLQWRTLFSADRTPTDSLTVGVVEIGPGELWLHRHAQAEVYYILEGTGVVQIDGREHTLSPGTAVFIPGNAEHAARCTGATTLRLLYAFAVASFAEVEYVFENASNAPEGDADAPA